MHRYGVVYTRFLTPLIILMSFFKVDKMDIALECSFLIVWVVNPLLLEIYIQMYLTDATKKRATKSIPQQEAKMVT
jgi:ATP/ADP translocase